MKKIIIKNLKELIIILLIYFSGTIILSLIFKTTTFKSTTWVFVITLVLTKLIVTIYECKKAND